MEMLVGRIFDRVEQNPDSVDDIGKLMEYYLPTTIKLLEAYEELEDILFICNRKGRVQIDSGKSSTSSLEG